MPRLPAVLCLALATACSPGPGDGPAGEGPAGAPPLPPASCASGTPGPGSSPLRRLTQAEYLNTVLDLFRIANGNIEGDLLRLVDDSPVGGFTNLAEGQAVTPLHVEYFQDAAAYLGVTAVDDKLDQWAPCVPDFHPELSALDCATQDALSLAARAFRHPLDDDERARVTALVTEAVGERGFQDGLHDTVEAIVSSPRFLYLTEGGDPGLDAAADLLALDGWEVAARLSYLLWQTMPDDELTAVAAAGGLATADGVEAEARRMLDTARAQGMVRDFHRQWLRLDRLGDVDLVGGEFASLYERRALESMDQGLDAFLQHQFFDEGMSLETLLTSTDGYVNDESAPFYDLGDDVGVPVDDGADGPAPLARRDLDPATRAGILTQPGVLTSTSHGISHSPVQRGLLVLDSFFCFEMPPPPPDVNTNVPAPPEGTVLTTRQRFEEFHGTAGESCLGCHQVIDGLGFAYEGYDAAGRHRTTENGLAVDTTGHVQVGSDVDGVVTDAVDLAHKLASSQTVERCVAAHWYRFGLGHLEAPADACALDQLTQTFDREGKRPKELVVDIARSDAFRFRTAD